MLTPDNTETMRVDLALDLGSGRRLRFVWQSPVLDHITPRTRTIFVARLKLKIVKSLHFYVCMYNMLTPKKA